MEPDNQFPLFNSFMPLPQNVKSSSIKVPISSHPRLTNNEFLTFYRKKTIDKFLKRNSEVDSRDEEEKEERSRVMSVSEAMGFA